MAKNNNTKKKKDKAGAVQQAKFNSVTNSADAENQNQGHNVKKEALGPNTKR